MDGPMDVSSITPEMAQAELDSRQAASAPTGLPGAVAGLGAMESNAVAGFNQGAQNFGTNAIASLRHFSDALGITDPAQTQAGEQQMTQQNQQFNQSPAGQSTTGQVASTVGQIAPAMAVGLATGATSV